MWICLNNAFFSIVDAKRADDSLVVRARRKGDIEAVFGVPGVYSPGRDYAYRCFLQRDVVASVLMAQVLGIDYGNFKSSVKDDALHAAYNRVWSVMGDLQVGGPYGRRPVSQPAAKSRRRGRQASLALMPFHDDSPDSDAHLFDDRGPTRAEIEAWDAECIAADREGRRIR